MSHPCLTFLEAWCPSVLPQLILEENGAHTQAHLLVGEEVVDD